MVKDDFHKTRALTSRHGRDLDRAREQAVFTFIYKLQEEVHRFTVSRMKDAKSRSMRRSSLEDIPGIGPTKAKALLAAFGTLANVREATPGQLREIKLLSSADADRVYGHFHSKGEA